MSSTCNTCIHHFELPKLEGGGMVCRASPPTPFLLPAPGGGAQVMAFFPPVNASISCGLYETDIDISDNDDGKELNNESSH